MHCPISSRRCEEEEPKPAQAVSGVYLGGREAHPLPNQVKSPRGTPVEEAPTGGDWKGQR